MISISGFYIGQVLAAVFTVLLQASQSATPVDDPAFSDDQVKLVVILVVVFAFVAIFGLFFVVKAYRELKKQYRIIQKQHDEIAAKNEELALKNETLEELNIEKNNTLSVVAHDLKAPLSNMQGLVELIKLQKENLTPEQLQYLEMISQVAADTANMVDVMLDVHKIESELHELALHEYDAVELVAKSVAIHEPAAKLKKVNISFTHPDEPLPINTDKHYFQQIISNILQNAIDFSPEGGTVKVDLRKQDNLMQVSIMDEGPGISQADQKRLFSSYKKLEGEGTAGKSSGIGLVIVMRLLEKLHGKIDVDSTEGVGSTFVVSFPA